MNQTLRYGTSFQKLRARYAPSRSRACYSQRVPVAPGPPSTGPTEQEQAVVVAFLKLPGNPPSTATNDTVDRFVGQPKTPAPGVCPSLP